MFLKLRTALSVSIKSAILIRSLTVILFIGLLFNCSNIACASNRKWSFDFNNCKVKEALREISNATGIWINTNASLEKAPINKRFNNTRLDKILTEILLNENCAIVWHYEADSLKYIDVVQVASSPKTQGRKVKNNKRKRRYTKGYNKGKRRQNNIAALPRPDITTDQSFIEKQSVSKAKRNQPEISENQAPDENHKQSNKSDEIAHSVSSVNNAEKSDSSAAGGSLNKTSSESSKSTYNNSEVSDSVAISSAKPSFDTNKPDRTENTESVVSATGHSTQGGNNIEEGQFMSEGAGHTETKPDKEVDDSPAIELENDDNLMLELGGYHRG